GGKILSPAPTPSGLNSPVADPISPQLPRDAPPNRPAPPLTPDRHAAQIRQRPAAPTRSRAPVPVRPSAPAPKAPSPAAVARSSAPPSPAPPAPPPAGPAS